MESGGIRRETLDAVDRAGAPGEPVTANELADELECTRRTAYDRLERLANDGDLETKKIGARGRVWWRPRRSDPRDGVAHVLEKADVGVFVLDEAFDVAWINEAAERYFGVDREDVVGRDKRAVIDETIASRMENPTAFREAVTATYDDNADAERFECRVGGGENRDARWLEHRSEPIETGRYAGGRVELYYDVSERRETERLLDENDQQFRSLVETTEEYAIFRLDADGRVATWNAGAERIKGYEREEILGERIAAFYTDADAADGVPERHLAEAAAEGSIEVEGWRVRADGSRFWASATITAIYDADGDVEGFAKVTRDMTERREYENRLQRQRDDLQHELDEVFERIDDAFYAVDEEHRFTYVNEQAEALLQHPAEELLGESVWEMFPEATETDAWESFHRAQESQESTSYEVYFEPLEFWVEANVYPSETGLSVYFRDVTERKERERELRESEQRYRTLIENFPNGGVALYDEDLRHLLVEGKGFEELDFDADDLLDERVPDLYPPDVLETLEPNYRAALEGETTEFEVEVQGRTFQFWALPVTDDDGEVFAGMAMSQDVTDRIERQRTLERQREQLEALNELNAVALDIAEAVVEQSTREEIERVVCEGLAASDSYEFAWMAGVDPATESIEPHVEAGVDGYLDATPISVDPDDPTGRGPAGMAVQTGEMRVLEDAFADPDFAPWRDVAREYGYRTSAAVPITHEGSIFGVLGVYADRSDAFTGDERRVIRQLGEVTGHAIAAVERKRALIGDELVEIEFRIRDVFEMLDLDVDTDGLITLDQTVPLSEGEHLAYGTASEGTGHLVDTLVETLDHWEEVTFDGDEAFGSFELSLADPPVLTTVASLGGRIAEAAIEDGDYRMTVHLSPGVDVRQVIDSVQDAYPGAELVTRRQISRTDDAVDTGRSVLAEDLTDRQRAALEAAFYAGFFEWPREHSGGEIAESLGISSPTFHQHVRAAERKVFTSLLGDSLPTAD